MTAHRDLEQLAREGLVERVRGGARARPSGLHPTAWEHRIAQAQAAKAAIAARAAEFVTGGSTIFLDASSTAFALASALAEAPPYELTLVTNSPMIAAGPPRRGDPRRRLPGRARSADARGRRPLDGRLHPPA